MRVCSQCGNTTVPETGKFCPRCGATLTQAPLATTGIAAAPPPPGRGLEFNWTHTSRRASQRATENSVGGGTAAAAAGSAHWPFQQQTTELASTIIRGLGQSRSSFAGRIVRGALVDYTIYREVASDSSLQSEAWKVLGLIVVMGSMGFVLLSPSSISLQSLIYLGSVAVIQLIGLLAKAWIVQIAASQWLQKRTTFNELFRALTYAQSPAMLQIVPIVGLLAGLWCLVTNTAAIRDVTGCETSNAAILALIGVAGVIVAAYFATPLVVTFLG